MTEAAASRPPKTSTRFPAVDIDTGRFKYVLIKVTDPTGNTFDLVRGHSGPGFGYHVDVARPTVTKLREAGWEYHVLGGGRIEHDPTLKRILVYGALPDACAWLDRNRNLNSCAYYPVRTHTLLTLLHVLVSAFLLFVSNTGHSYGFPWSGKSKHDVTVELLQKQYPDYAIKWTDDGY